MDPGDLADVASIANSAADVTAAALLSAASLPPDIAEARPGATATVDISEIAGLSPLGFTGGGVDPAVAVDGGCSPPAPLVVPAVAGAHADEYAYVRIRYKPPAGGASVEIARAATRADEFETLAAAPAAAAFGQLLRDGRCMEDYCNEDAAVLADGAKGADPFGYRAEFVSLARLAHALAEADAPRQ